MEFVGVCLFILLGASVAYLIDAIFNLTPRLAGWIARSLGTADE